MSLHVRTNSKIILRNGSLEAQMANLSRIKRRGVIDLEIIPGHSDELRIFEIELNLILVKSGLFANR